MWLRAVAYMLAVGGVHFVGLPWLLLSVDNGYPPSFDPRSVRATIVLRDGPVALVAVLLIVLGASLAWLSAAYLVTRGRGTPFPLDSTRVLVRDGPYRYVRNPQAIAAMLIVGGECLLVESRWLWLLLPVTFVYLELLAAPIEDCQLRHQFGAAYLAYRQHVPRWLPRPGRSRSQRG